MRDDFGDRMKAYEAIEVERRFIPMIPVYARIDGRNFSAFTKGMDRPYDVTMTAIMAKTAKSLVAHTNARIGYTQSDEISLVWQSERYDQTIFFNHRIAKMTSVLASYATAVFTRLLYDSDLRDYAKRLPHFDCRVFQFPNRTEAANTFLWREQDATRNAIHTAVSTVYSHKECQGKNRAEMQEMMFAKGINFNDYPAFFKRGTFVRRVTVEQPDLGDGVYRTEVRSLDMPRFGSVKNREGVIFDSEDPIGEYD